MRTSGLRNSASKAATIIVLASSTLHATASRAQVKDAVSLPDPATSATLIRFAIAPQPLSSAIVAFSRATGCDLIFDGAIASGMRTKGVEGAFTAQNGLERLLAGTGLAARLSNERMMRMFRASAAENEKAEDGATPLDPIDIAAPKPAPNRNAVIGNLPAPYAGGQVATGAQLGILGNLSVMDAPFNITSYTARKIQDQQAASVRDALIDEPSVRSVWPNGSSLDQAVWIRGFYVSPLDTSFNGLFGLLPVAAAPAEMPERIELLKGPSAMLTGMPPASAIGGAINIVPKRADDEPLTQITLGYASLAQYRAHVDIGRRFGSNNEFGVRFNGVFRNGRTAVDRNFDQIGAATLGMDYKGDGARLSADIGYSTQDIDGLLSLVSPNSGVATPSAPKNYVNFGQRWSYTERKDLFGAIRGEIDLTDQIMAYAAFGGHDNSVRTLTNGNAMLTGANGTITQTPFKQAVYNAVLTGEAGLRAQHGTGPVDHALSVGATAIRYEAGFDTLRGSSFASNIYVPILVPEQAIADPTARKSSVTTLSSFAFADTMSIAENRIRLTAGGRVQRVKAENFDTTTGAATSDYDQSAFSPSIALVIKPVERLSLYANYIEGLQPGQTVDSIYANAGQVFAPFKSTQIETGAKIDWGRFTTSLSLFEISQPSAILDAATNRLEVAGEQRNRGVELGLFGEPADGVRLLGGAMYLDAAMTKTGDRTTGGWRAFGSPRIQMNLAVEWDVPFLHGFAVIGRGSYTGSQFIDASSPRRSIPDWARFDLGARYTFETSWRKPVTVRFNVENVLDAGYWTTAYYGYLTQGTPRVFRLSTTVAF